MKRNIPVKEKNLIDTLKKNLQAQKQPTSAKETYVSPNFKTVAVDLGSPEGDKQAKVLRDSRGRFVSASTVDCVEDFRKRAREEAAQKEQRANEVSTAIAEARDLEKRLQEREEKPEPVTKKYTVDNMKKALANAVKKAEEEEARRPAAKSDLDALRELKEKLDNATIKKMPAIASPEHHGFYETERERIIEKNPQSYEHVNHPSHYNNYDIEVIEMMRRIWGDKATATFCEMNAFKYRMRMGTKPDNSTEQDLKKEQWYLNKAKELRLAIEQEN